MDNTKLKSRLATKAQALQEAPAEREPASLVPVESGYAALNGNTLDLIRENLKEQPLTYQMFDVVKSPSGGSTVFTVPGLAGDEAEKELTGIILDYTTPRAYWDTPDPVEGTPPTCLSHNSLVSEDGKACAHCPFNDYGSKDGETGAKACKESVLLFLLRPGNVLPLAAPVGSGSSDQQGAVPQVCGPAHQLTDPTERRGHPDHPAESHQPGRQALCPLPF